MMNDIFTEIRMSRALAIAVDQLLREQPTPTAETMENVRQKYNELNLLYRQQMDRELS